MQQYELTTDANGFALFDPASLSDVLGRDVAEGENLLALFQQSSLGQRVLEQGALVPIYPMTDGLYRIRIRLADEAEGAATKEQIVARNGKWPLCVRSDLFLGDLAVVQEWIPELGWNGVAVEAGCYSVDVLVIKEGSVPTLELVLAKEAALPQLSASPRFGYDAYFTQ